MNIVEMQNQFGIQMNQFSEGLQLHSDDIMYWLNKAQLEIVKQAYNGMNQQRKAFEQSQERIDDLRVLIEKNHAISTNFAGEASAVTGFYADRSALPDNYMFLLSQRSEIKYFFPVIEYQVINNKRLPMSEHYSKIVFNRYSQSDDIYSLLSDPFNTTKASSPLTDIHENHIDVYTDKTFFVDKLIINYLRLPVEVSLSPQQNCELPEHLHKDIIDRAVTLFLHNTRELKQRLQRETPVTGRTSIEEQDEHNNSL